MKKCGLIAVIILLVAGGSVYVIGHQFHWWGGSCEMTQSISRRQGERDSSIDQSGRVGIISNGSGLRSKNVVTPGGGAVLENNDDRVAYRTKVVFHVEGYRLIGSKADGRSKDRSFDFTVEIPFIMPGRRAVVAGRYPGIDHVAMQNVEPKTTTWVSRDDLGDGFSPPKSSYRGTVHRGSGKLDEIRYTERSKSCRTLRSRGTAVVFRNKKGQIVGGDLLKPRGGKARPCSPGRHEFRLPVPNKVPPRADDSRTEVYSYCDLNVPKHDVNKRPS